MSDFSATERSSAFGDRVPPGPTGEISAFSRHLSWTSGKGRVEKRVGKGRKGKGKNNMEREREAKKEGGRRK